MKRRVVGHPATHQKNQRLLNNLWLQLFKAAFFITAGSLLLVRLFSAEPQTSLLTAIIRSLIIVVPLSLLMLLARPLYFFIGLGFFGSVLLSTSGFTLGYLGGLLWVCGGTAAFLLTISFFANYITPPLNDATNRASYNSFLLLLRYSVGNTFSRRSRSKHQTKNIPISFDTLKAGEIPFYHCYAIYRNATFNTALKPGFALLNSGDQIHTVYDLRPQIRQINLDLATRDGIPITTKLSVEFFIRRPRNRQRSRLPFPFETKAIHDLCKADTVELTEREHTIHPFDQVVRRGEFFATKAIAERTLDDLLQVNSADGQPLRPVINEVRERLAKQFNPKGIHIYSVRLAPLSLPSQVQKTQLAAWEKSWQKPIENRNLGKGIGRISPEQARAQLEVIEDLMENLDTFADADSEIAIRDDILAQVRTVITDAAAEGLLQTLIPEPKQENSAENNRHANE